MVAFGKGSHEHASSTLAATYISSPKRRYIVPSILLQRGAYMETRIETVELPVSQIKTGFGNPRKITKIRISRSVHLYWPFSFAQERG